MSAGTRRKQDTQDREAGSNGRGEPSNEPGQLSELLQRQISEALEPIVGDLRDQMVETVRSQVEENLSSDQIQKLQQGQQGDEQPRRKRQRGRQRQDEQGDEDSGSPIQGAVQQSTSLLQKLYRWLADTVRGLLNTVREWLSSVVEEVRQYVIKVVGAALIALLRPILKAAIQKMFESVQKQGKDKVLSFGQSSAK